VAWHLAGIFVIRQNKHRNTELTNIGEKGHTSIENVFIQSGKSSFNFFQHLKASGLAVKESK
jgi:hypothetical protein